MSWNAGAVALSYSEWLPGDMITQDQSRRVRQHNFEVFQNEDRLVEGSSPQTISWNAGAAAQAPFSNGAAE